MTGENSIRELMQTAMDSLRELVDVNTIVGQRLDAGSVTVLPVSSVSCGFLAGGGEYGRAKEAMPFAGGSGAGISLQPVGFLVIEAGQVRMIPVSGATALDKAIEAVPLLTRQLRSVIGQDAEKN